MTTLKKFIVKFLPARKNKNQRIRQILACYVTRFNVGHRPVKRLVKGVVGLKKSGVSRVHYSHFGYATFFCSKRGAAEPDLDGARVITLVDVTESNASIMLTAMYPVVLLFALLFLFDLAAFVIQREQHYIVDKQAKANELLNIRAQIAQLHEAPEGEDARPSMAEEVEAAITSKLLWGWARFLRWYRKSWVVWIISTCLRALWWVFYTFFWPVIKAIAQATHFLAHWFSKFVVWYAEYTWAKGWATAPEYRIACVLGLPIVFVPGFLLFLVWSPPAALSFTASLIESLQNTDLVWEWTLDASYEGLGKKGLQEIVLEACEEPKRLALQFYDAFFVRVEKPLYRELMLTSFEYYEDLYLRKKKAGPSVFIKPRSARR